MKKVLFVATVARQHIMQFHLPYLKMFQDMGYEVHVAAKNDFLNGETSIPFCDSFHDFPFNRTPWSKDNLKTYKLLTELIEEEKYDIIHCHTPMGAALGRLAAKSIMKKDVNYNPDVIYTAHGFHFYTGAPKINWLLYYPVEKYLSNYTDKLITINSEDYKRAQKKFKAKKTYLVNGVGVDLSRFSESKKSRKDVLNTLDIPNDNFVILSVGELNTNKNHQQIINALGQLTNSDVTYMIAGLGQSGEDLKRCAQENNVDLRLLGYRNDVSELLHASDMYAFPSKREGLSLSLMEAMSCKIPILASKIRGNSDLIEDHVNGRLFNLKDDSSSIGEIIQNMINNPQERKKYAEESFKKVQAYSLQEVAPIMKKIYLA